MTTLLGCPIPQNTNSLTAGIDKIRQIEDRYLSYVYVFVYRRQIDYRIMFTFPDISTQKSYNHSFWLLVLLYILGPMGPLVMQDTILIEKIQHFTREKIPARNVHALGYGCYGKLTITNDITKYTKAKVFSTVGKTTNLFCRMSGVFTEQVMISLPSPPIFLLHHHHLVFILLFCLYRVIQIQFAIHEGLP